MTHLDLSTIFWLYFSTWCSNCFRNNNTTIDFDHPSSDSVLYDLYYTYPFTKTTFILTRNSIISATKTSIVLKDSKDWQKWISVILTTSQEHGLCDYVNPNTPRTDLLVLSKPIKPTPNTIKPFVPPATEPNATGTTKYKDLNKGKRAQLALDTSIYIHESADYEKKIQALGRLHTKILETIYSDNLPYTFNKTTIYDILLTLKERFAPSDYARKQEYTIK